MPPQAWQMEEALSAYEKWGIKGIKVDFMENEWEHA